MSLFITFEGGEGSGKSYQSQVLYDRLVQRNIPALLTHEPGGTKTGEKITELLKWSRETSISPLTELFLFNASRSQLVGEVIRPALKKGKTVICDRYTDSTVCYQSFGRGLDLELVRNINDAASRGLVPGLTVLMDIPVRDGFSRITGKKPDRFEQEDIEFHRRIREGFLKLAEEEPERFLVIDATLSRQEISDIIWDKAGELLEISG
jgi:dTMP kinase